MTHGAVRWWLRLEGLAVLCAAIWLYEQHGTGWLLFALLFLAPDLSFAGYLGGPRIGALVYNLAHSYVLPLALVLGSVVGGRIDLVWFALIWIGHIGFDRALGFGLKYPGAFAETHLGVIGRDRAVAR
ncbi:MAG TPA: DUF4260 domain-containing protein [Gemmatimonadaceae bacterium]|nr:DUF4260 domain-containing protein [Gemmatimonadaceae bacterium]